MNHAWHVSSFVFIPSLLLLVFCISVFHLHISSSIIFFLLLPLLSSFFLIYVSLDEPCMTHPFLCPYSSTSPYFSGWFKFLILSLLPLPVLLLLSFPFYAILILSFIAAAYASYISSLTFLHNMLHNLFFYTFLIFKYTIFLALTLSSTLDFLHYSPALTTLPTLLSIFFAVSEFYFYPPILP